MILFCTLGASSAGATPSLRLEASPRQLLSGRDTRTLLTVSGPGLSSDVRLACSAGRLLQAKRSARGTLQTSFLPPRTDTLAPILCAAVSPSSGAVATVVLEVQRRQVLHLGGLPPLGRVEVFIGDSRFGPVRANAAGEAEASVLLTPFVAQGTVSATAPGQPEQRRLLELPVSLRPVVLLVAEASSLSADGQSGLRVWAFSIDGRGESQDAPLALSRTAGTFELQRVAPGVQVGTFTPFPRAAPGQAVLTARSGTSDSSVRLELRAGVKPTLSVEAASGELLADGASGTDITVHVRDAQGRGLPGQPVRLEATRGELTLVQDREDGTYLAHYRSPVGGDEERLVASLQGAPPATLVLKLRPPPRLTLEASERVLPADGVTRLVLRLTARDPGGHLVPDGTDVTLSTTLGTVPASVRTRDGRATFEWVAGRQAGEAVLQANLREASASTSVQLVPGSPARLSLRTEAREVRCDGADSAQVHLLVQDAHGNPLDDVPPTLSAAGTQAEHGHFERVAALGGGEFLTRFHPPARCEGGVATLLASAGEARGDARLRLATRTSRGLTVRLGAQSNLGRLVLPALELEVDARPYAFGERLVAGASVQVASGRRLSLTGESFAHEPFEVSVWPLLATASGGVRWHQPLSSALSAYVGAGLDAHVVHFTWRLSLEQQEQRQLSVAFGGHLRLGLMWSLGPGEAVLQGRYALSRLPADVAFRGSAGGPSFSLGYRFPL
ncbi:invasin domain 3-containing protein [Archangium sp.]|uniref:invasin domain 3-containing protein n=1 Tax=Archangium sp. TaxID=1872627 RepID=UPI00286C291F|nr:invasin domain 3-containing protein [Archangium sp.]